MGNSKARAHPLGQVALREKDVQKEAPWIKVGLWKMGTLPNSGEDDVIPAEANQNTPLGSQ